MHVRTNPVLKVSSAYTSIWQPISSLQRTNKLLRFEDLPQTEDLYLAIRRIKLSKCLEQKQTTGINHDIQIKDLRPA